MKPILCIVLFFFTCCFGSVAFAQQSKKQPTVTEEVAVPEADFYVANNRLIVRNVPVGSQIEIYTILGNKVKQIEIKSPDGEFDLNLPRAIYIFRLNVNGAVRKFVIR